MVDTTDMSAGQGKLRDGPARYGAISRINHWVFALAIGVMLFTGYAGEILPLDREAMRAVMGQHQALGALVLGLALWRVGWRLISGFPQSVSAARWQRHAAHLVHWALLALVLAMPISGVLMVLTGGHSLDVFGLTIPAIGDFEELHEAFEELHEAGAFALGLLIVLHVGAALKHHVIDRDHTLRRMIRG